MARTNTTDPATRKAVDAGAGSALRRLKDRLVRPARKARANVTWRVAVMVSIGVYAALMVSLGPGWGTATAITMLLVAAALRALVVSPQALVATVSLAVTEGVVWGLLAPLMPGRQPHPSLVFLPVAAAVWPFLQARQIGPRGLSVILSHAGLLVAGLLIRLAPVAGSIVALLWVVLVALWRGGGLSRARMLRAKWRTGLRGKPGSIDPAPLFADDDGVVPAGFTSEYLDRGVDAELRTGALLTMLPPEWTVLHSRQVPGSHADVDHVVVGPGGVFIVDSKDWKGKVTTTAADGPETGMSYLLNGSSQKLMDRIEPSVFEARRVTAALGLPAGSVHSVIVFTGRMRLPERVTSLTLWDVWDSVDRVNFDATVHLMLADDLPDWVTAFPGELTPARKRRRGDQSSYVRDVAALADWALAPKA